MGTTEQTASLAEFFEYLDALRESGATNMFGAAPWLANAFEIPVTEARTILSSWQRTFDLEHSAAERAAKSLPSDEPLTGEAGHV